MIDLVKGLAEVHNDDIRLPAFTEFVGEVMDELNELGFTTAFTTEPMLV